jgi:hypothetical protein
VIGAGLGLIMPILALAVQNAFPANRRGVVTSASTFFRQMGGTVGITVFGVIFNHQIRHQFELKLAPEFAKMQPLLAQMPAQSVAFFQQVAKDPQILIRVLLSPEAQAAIPAAFKGPFILGIKEMMSASLHVVFWTSIAVVAVGLVTVQFLGNVSLKRQAAELGEEVHLESPLMAE